MIVLLAQVSSHRKDQIRKINVGYFDSYAKPEVPLLVIFT
jgi:hypothetical protein